MLERYINFAFDRAMTSEADRTIPVCFSSEAAVDRGDFDEILDHSAEGMDLTRLKDSHPLLLEHNPRELIGVIEKAEISKEDRKGRAIVRFGNSKLADEVFKDVKSGIRPHISVGYERTRTLSTEVDADGRKKIRFAWRPFEISSVAVPADLNAKVGRGSDALKQRFDEIFSKALTQFRESAEEVIAELYRPTPEMLAAAAKPGENPLKGNDRDEEDYPDGKDDKKGSGEEEDDITAEGENGGTVVDPDPRCRPETPIPSPVLKPEQRCRVDA